MSTRNSPYPKKPTSQFAAPAFYWRGGDVLREREYLADEYKKALADYRKAESECKAVETSLTDASETLQEREVISDTLANYLDADTEGNQTEHNYKRQLTIIEQQIKEAEIELQSARAVHHPAVASSLQKEKAYLQLEMQRVSKAIELAREQHHDDKRKLAEIAINNKYQVALDLEGKFQELNRKKAFLRQLVNRNKKDFDSTKPVVGAQTTEMQRERDARSERSFLISQIEIEQSLDRAEEKKKRRPSKWTNEIDRLLMELEDLNDRMFDLGMNDQTVDIEELRRKYLEEESGGAEEEKTNNIEEEEKNE